HPAKATYASVVAGCSKDSDSALSDQHPITVGELPHIPNTAFVGESQLNTQTVSAVRHKKPVAKRMPATKGMPATNAGTKLVNTKNQKAITKVATKKTKGTPTDCAICYICYKRVLHLKSHLTLACFPKRGYSQPQRMRVMAKEKRFQRWLNACVTTAQLYSNSVIGPDNKAFVSIDYVINILEQNGVLICQNFNANSFLNHAKETNTDSPKLPQLPSSPVLAREQTVSNIPGGVSPIAGPSGLCNQRRVSDAKRQLFDDDEEEPPILEMNFLDGSGRDDEPILTVRTVNLNQSSSSEDIPLASLQSKSHQPFAKFTNLVKKRDTPALIMNKFNLDVCPALRRYTDYLEDTVKVSNPTFINPSISNINKVLNFLHPEAEKLESLCDTRKLQEFFNKMPTDMSFHYYNNYIKAILRF
ncbi:hypothetical protein ACJMK2_004772, partial [Sinanodonta woodiana]